MTAVRPARPSDLRDLARLCAEHADHERAAHDGSGLAERLEPALFGPEPRLRAWVVECDRWIRGYASATVDFSTWTGRSYLHLDCLYLEKAYRGRGLGRHLIDAIFAAAREAGLGEVQWQTPEWNQPAIRFYERYGARGVAKVRFSAPARPMTPTCANGIDEQPL